MNKMALASNRSAPAALPAQSEGYGGAENEKARTVAGHELTIDRPERESFQERALLWSNQVGMFCVFDHGINDRRVVDENDAIDHHKGLGFFETSQGHAEPPKTKKPRQMPRLINGADGRR
jgi:hypothetical protein